MRSILRHPLVLTIGGLILLVFLLRVGALRPLERGLMFMFTPVQSRLYALSLSIRELPLFRWRAERDHDRVMNQLTHENAELARQLTQARLAADENQTLRKLLRFREETNTTLVSARVLLRRMDPGTFSIFLDRGHDDGIRVGMPVVTENGIMVGKITETHATLSEAAFLPDPRFRAATTLTSILGTNGYLKGEGGVSILMDLIPVEQKIKKGDIVISSGLETGVPRGLVIGTIESELPASQSLFRRAAVRPMIALHRIADVAIIVPPAPQ